jgi:hypothetical protein
MGQDLSGEHDAFPFWVTTNITGQEWFDIGLHWRQVNIGDRFFNRDWTRGRLLPILVRSVQPR